ncbi:hypothetical protein D9M69_657480 [compost metagenome]
MSWRVIFRMNSRGEYPFATILSDMPIRKCATRSSVVMHPRAISSSRPSLMSWEISRLNCWAAMKFCRQFPISSQKGRMQTRESSRAIASLVCVPVSIASSPNTAPATGNAVICSRPDGLVARIFTDPERSQYRFCKGSPAR